MFQSTRKKPTGENTHNGICQQELAKGAPQEKEEQDIYIYTFSTNLILILIPILTSPKTLIF
jgi:hypothetical protein